MSDDSTQRFYDDVWPHAGTVLRTAVALCRDRTEADDLTQETFLKAFRSLHQLKAGDDARPWLLTILRHTRIDRLRSAKARGDTASLDQLEIDPADDGPDEPDNDPASWADPAAMLQQFADEQMIDALRQLPEEIRWTLLLVDVQGIDLKDAAVVMDVPVGTVKSRAHRGRAMLRAALLPVAKDLRIVR